MADPYASIPLLAFDYTFNTLLARPDASQQQRQWLQEGKQEFLRTRAKELAMQALLRAYPNQIIIPTMTQHVREIGQQPQQQQPTRPPQQPPAVMGMSQQQQAILMQQQQRAAQMAAQQQARPLSYPPGARPGAPPGGLPQPSAALQAGGAKRGREGDGADAGRAGPAGGKPGEEEGAEGPPKETDALADVGFTLEDEQKALLASSAGRGPRMIRSLRDVALPHHLAEPEPLLNAGPLLQRMNKVAARHGLASVDPACVAYLTQALEAHMGRLLTAVARVAMQRTDPSRQYEGAVPQAHDRPRKRHATPAAATTTTDAAAQPPGDPAAAAASSRPPGATQPQSMLVFRKVRPLLIKMELGDTGGLSTYFAGVTRPLESTTTLSPPPSVVSSSAAATAAAAKGPSAPKAAATQGEGAQAPGADAARVLVLRDLVSTLEKDTLLSKHPVVWKLHHKLAAASGGAEGGAIPLEGAAAAVSGAAEM